MSDHELKVQPPYFDALANGQKPFEVRRNDRAYQRGDTIRFREFHPARFGEQSCHACRNHSWNEHYTDREVTLLVLYVYSGDPRFGGLEPGHVVLGLGGAS